jgi:hypothetical protein
LMVRPCGVDHDGGCDVTVALLVVAGVATVVVLACETMMERRRRRWVGWLEAAIVLFLAVDFIGFRIAAVPWLLWLVTAIMVLVAAWRLNQLGRLRVQRHKSPQQR